MTRFLGWVLEKKEELLLIQLSRLGVNSVSLTEFLILGPSLLDLESKRQTQTHLSVNLRV